MILDDRLIASGHEDEMLDSGLARFLDDMLKDRAIDDGQHFLGNRFGGREKPCSQAGDGKNSLANALRHQFLNRCAALFGFLPHHAHAQTSCAAGR